MERPVEFNNYTPFGSEWTSDVLGTEQKLRFTGHERDLMDPTHTTDDLDSMHARHYNLNLARFLSVDPVGGDPFNPQSWNAYAYVLNNPLKYTDPFGMTISFNDTQAEDAFWDYWNSLDPASVDMQNLMELEDSNVEYVYSVETRPGASEGEVTTDGIRVFLNVESGGPAEDSSRLSRFAHETAHGVQFNRGLFGFVRMSVDDPWGPWLMNIDEEVDAWNAQIRNNQPFDPHMKNVRGFMKAKDKAKYLMRHGYEGYVGRPRNQPVPGRNLSSGTIHRTNLIFFRAP